MAMTTHEAMTPGALRQTLIELHRTPMLTGDMKALVYRRLQELDAALSSNDERRIALEVQDVRRMFRFWNFDLDAL